MSDDTIKSAPASVQLPTQGKKSSGEHPIMVELHKKLDEIKRGPHADLKRLNKRIDRLKAKSDPPNDENEIPIEEDIPDTEPEGGQA